MFFSPFQDSQFLVRGTDVWEGWVYLLKLVGSNVIYHYALPDYRVLPLSIKKTTHVN
jgi:hypothetical protein